MRRSVLALIGTVAGTTLMLGAKLGTPAPAADPAAASLGGTADGAGAAGPDDPGASSAPAASGRSGTPAPGPAPAPGSSSRVPVPAPPGRSTPPTTNPPASGLKDGRYTGSGAVPHYGYTMSVTITISGGRITAATGSCGSASGASRDYCTGALPKLQQETLTAQSASVATVSGASYSSRGYRTSLQAALDAAKA